MALTPPKFVEDLGARLAQIASSGPVADLENNARAMLAGALERLDMVSREEFDVQKEVLRRTRERLEELERRVAELEAAAREESTGTSAGE